MMKSVWWVRVGVYAAGLAACGSVRPDSTPVDGQSSDAAPPPQFLSCVGLPATCGASGNDNCCNSPEVPGGSYDRSYDLAGDGNSGTTSFPATVSNFRLDKYEVTVGRFRAFVNAGMGTRTSAPPPGAGAHANIAGSGWDATWNASLAMNTVELAADIKCDPTFETWTDTPAASEHRPMNCITWYEAMAFCTWDGGYLPTEAEWNYAGAGGDEQRAYPWSSPASSLTVDGSHASYDDGTNCVGDGIVGCALTDLVAVGTKPSGDGRWGQSDLAGNVYEWMLDWYASTYVNPCMDCAVVTATPKRVDRGGSFNFGASSLRAGDRGSNAPLVRDRGIGVRCARTL